MSFDSTLCPVRNSLNRMCVFGHKNVRFSESNPFLSHAVELMLEESGMKLSATYKLRVITRNRLKESQVRKWQRKLEFVSSFHWKSIYL